MNALRVMILLNRVETRFKRIMETRGVEGRQDIMEAYREAVQQVLEELADEKDA